MDLRAGFGPSICGVRLIIDDPLSTEGARVSEPGQRYRSKGRIFADILRAIQESGQAKVTHVLYKANLSHDRLSKYLTQLEQCSLIQRNDDGERQTYSITKQGEAFLVEFRRMEEFASAFGLDI